MKRLRGLWISIGVVVALVAASILALSTGRLKPQLGLDLQGGIEVILSAPAGTPPDVMARAVENIRNRVDAFGVGEPDIAFSGTSILVQIPGSGQSTVQERQQTTYCLTGNKDAVYGCSQDASVANDALDQLGVVSTPTKVCLVAADDERLQCFPNQSQATNAMSGIQVSPKATPTPSASATPSPSGSTSASASSSPSAEPSVGPPPAPSAYCLTTSDGKELRCFDTKDQATAASKDVTTKVTDKTWCVVPQAPEATSTPTPTASGSASASESASPTGSASSKASPSGEASPSGKASPSGNPSASGTPSVSASASASTTPSPSASPAAPAYASLNRDGLNDLPCSLPTKAKANAAKDAVAMTTFDVQYCVVSAADEDLGCFPTRAVAASKQRETGQERLLKVIGETARLEQRPTLAIISPGSPQFASTPVTCPTLKQQDSPACKPDVLDPQPVVYFDQGGNKVQMGPVVLTGGNIKSATATIQGGTQTQVVAEWGVDFTLDSAGTEAFAAATTQAVSSPEPQNHIAIVVDRVVISNPKVINPITNGSGIITGSFTEDTAKDLATQLSAGALPVELTRESVRTVSPTLGEESLHQGIVAGLVGLVLLFLYLLFYYRLLGVVAWLGMSIWAALAVALVAIAGSQFGYALSLAGVAGLVISLGVTADSYVVFFERLKDEVRSGKSARSAVQPAFKRAFSTIVAADFVTGIAALVLYLTAVSSVKGFALTLGVATLLDLFVVYFFKRPTVFLIARSKRLTELHGFGLTSGVAAESHDAPAAGPIGGPA